MEESITLATDNMTLEGLFSVPEESGRTGVVICHPHPLYGGDMHNGVVAALAEGFQAAGLATLRFNFRGVGASQGEHGEGEAELADVNAAVDALSSTYCPAKIVVAGYSFGSMVGLKHGAADPRVNGLVAVALPVGRIDAAPLVKAAKPILLVSGDNDHISPLADLETLVGQLPEPRRLVTVAGADHFLAGREHEVARVATDFAVSL